MAHGKTTAPEQIQRMVDQEILDSLRKKHRFAVRHKTKNKVKVYMVQKTGAVGIRRYVKIKADANPYLPEYAAYYWQRRNNKESKLLPAMSAREYRAMAV